jgi:hypothetical protein
MSEQYNPNSPAGEVERFGTIADSLIRLHGWRRTLARVVVLLIVMVPLVVMVVPQFH